MDKGDGINMDEVYSKKIKAGKRIYFFDVKVTRGNDYYITITESKRRNDGQGYEKHKIFLYKEDFMKFASGLQEVINHVKDELIPDYNFHKYDIEQEFEFDENVKLQSDFDLINGFQSISENTDQSETDFTQIIN